MNEVLARFFSNVSEYSPFRFLGEIEWGEVLPGLVVILIATCGVAVMFLATFIPYIFRPHYDYLPRQTKIALWVVRWVVLMPTLPFFMVCLVDAIVPFESVAYSMFFLYAITACLAMGTFLAWVASGKRNDD